MISLVVAHGLNNEIGLDNNLLWKLPKDMKRFKEITTGHTVVMGRKTFESIGGPLPNRRNMVLTRTSFIPSLTSELTAVHSVDTVLNWAETKEREIFIIGGAEVYKAFLPFADRLYITLVRETFKADTFFPQYSHLLENYKVIEYEDVEVDENNPYLMIFLTYEKIR